LNYNHRFQRSKELNLRTNDEHTNWILLTPHTPIPYVSLDGVFKLFICTGIANHDSNIVWVRLSEVPLKKTPGSEHFV
jgi:hypothetical protein